MAIQNKLCKQIEEYDNEMSDMFKNRIQTVCYQGLPFSYSESAAKSLFKGKKLIYKSSFIDVFKDVYESEADCGVVPIENSTSGYINEIYDLLLQFDLYINYNLVKKIDHCIAGTKDSELDDIMEVHSHPQAVMQCREYIEKRRLRAVSESNTAVAAQKIYMMNNKNAACICSPEAAIHYGLKILDEKINSDSNYTRFAGISKLLVEGKNHNRISIVFSVPNVSGSLYEVLSLFYFQNINLSYIYSRPDLKSPWKYMLYLDFEGNIKDVNIKMILNQLKSKLPFVKILGSFEV